MASQNPQSHARRHRESEHNGESKANDILRETLEEFKERGDDVKTLVTEYIHDKPFKALGIALVTGMALAFFMKR